MSKEAKTSSSLQLRGKILALNLSPKGHIEGALVETPTGQAQINFPKHSAEALGRSMPVGSQIDLKVECETREGEHPVYTVGGEEAEAIGTIVGLNYTLHGAMNGYHLDNGIFIHVKPETARKRKLCIGEKVKATGSQLYGAAALVLEVRALEKIEQAS